MGNSSPRVRRFRINPVELVIFSAVTLIFVNSVYHLFYDWNAFQYTVLSEPVPEERAASGRRPASVSPYFASFEVACGTANQQATAVEKVRLTGPLCGSPETTPSQLVRTEISNAANKVEATVFTDTNAAKFSTDYVPLAPGVNPITLRFVYQGGVVITESLNIVRTADEKARHPAAATGKTPN